MRSRSGAKRVDRPSIDRWRLGVTRVTWSMVASGHRRSSRTIPNPLCHQCLPQSLVVSFSISIPSKLLYSIQTKNQSSKRYSPPTNTPSIRDHPHNVFTFSQNSPKCPRRFRASSLRHPFQYPPFKIKRPGRKTVE